MATSQIKVLDSVRGSSFLTSQAAMGVFTRHTPDIAPATIEVMRDGGSDFVVFTDKNRQLGVRAGTEVELSAQDLHILLTNKNRIKLDMFQGSSFLAIEAALEVFKSRNPDLDQYKIDVVRDGDFLVVIFSDKDRPKGSKGNLSPRLGFEAVLDPRDRRVLRSHFIR